MNEKNWYVIYTNPNSEKKVAQRLTQRQYEAFLPLINETRVWSDRKKIIQKPLFKSYVFVRCSPDSLHKVKTIYGFSHFICFGGYPVTISDTQIEEVQSIIKLYSETDAIATQFVVGDKVTITQGPLKGIQGILTNLKGKRRVAIEVSQLNQSMLVMLPEAYLTKLEQKDEHVK